MSSAIAAQLLIFTIISLIVLFSFIAWAIRFDARRIKRGNLAPTIDFETVMSLPMVGKYPPMERVIGVATENLSPGDAVYSVPRKNFKRETDCTICTRGEGEAMCRPCTDTMTGKNNGRAIRFCDLPHDEAMRTPAVEADKRERGINIEKHCCTDADCIQCYPTSEALAKFTFMKPSI